MKRYANIVHIYNECEKSGSNSHFDLPKSMKEPLIELLQLRLRRLKVLVKHRPAPPPRPPAKSKGLAMFTCVFKCSHILTSVILHCIICPIWMRQICLKSTEKLWYYDAILRLQNSIFWRSKKAQTPNIKHFLTHSTLPICNPFIYLSYN